MKTIQIVVLSTLVLLLLGGCATVSKAGYYWGNYPQTLYAYTKDPNAETLADHTKGLLNIIKISDERGLKVPPGIYAEIGYINAKSGKKIEARSFFESEMALYPESKQFLERLIIDAEKGGAS